VVHGSETNRTKMHDVMVFYSTREYRQLCLDADFDDPAADMFGDVQDVLSDIELTDMDNLTVTHDPAEDIRDYWGLIAEIMGSRTPHIVHKLATSGEN
jgi:hypothetical protein